LLDLNWNSALPRGQGHSFTRMVAGLKQLPYDQRLEVLSLWTLEEQRVRADLIEVYKIINGLSAVQFDSFSELDTNTRTRGHSLKLKLSH